MGVFPERAPRNRRDTRLPHTRGGVSTGRDIPRWALSSSPHTWGCFRQTAGRGTGSNVFPTHVGVFPIRLPSSMCSRSLPHTRGGVSGVKRYRIHKVVVFPTHVGVFLSPSQPRRSRGPSSPHTWGCFCRVRCRHYGSHVFPTHVGVFPCSCMPAIG